MEIITNIIQIIGYAAIAIFCFHELKRLKKTNTRQTEVDMKQGKNPTRTQKEIIARKMIAGKRLNPDNWLVIKDTGVSLTLENKASGKLKKIYYGEPIAQR